MNSRACLPTISAGSIPRSASEPRFIQVTVPSPVMAANKTELSSTSARITSGSLNGDG